MFKPNLYGVVDYCVVYSVEIVQYDAQAREQGLKLDNITRQVVDRLGRLDRRS
jgi:hypothetical protein